QFPAISGRMASVMSIVPQMSDFVALRCASRGAPPVPDTGQIILQAVNRFNWPTLPRLRGGRCHFMMLFQLGDALLRKSILNGFEFSPGTPRFPLSCKNKLDPCFEEFGKPHQTGSARPGWPLWWGVW